MAVKDRRLSFLQVPFLAVAATSTEHAHTPPESKRAWLPRITTSASSDFLLDPMRFPRSCCRLPWPRMPDTRRAPEGGPSPNYRAERDFTPECYVNVMSCAFNYVVMILALQPGRRSDFNCKLQVGGQLICVNECNAMRCTVNITFTCELKMRSQHSFMYMCVRRMTCLKLFHINRCRVWLLLCHSPGPSPRNDCRSSC